jgi:hypothetical protein
MANRYSAQNCIRPRKDGDWDLVKDRIVELYWDRDMDLTDVREAMRTQYGFEAT